MGNSSSSNPGNTEPGQHKGPVPSAAERGLPAGGGAGNRTRVLCRLTRASPCAVHCASTRPHRSREQAGVTGPAAVTVPLRSRGRREAVSLLADAGYRAGGAPEPTTLRARSGGEGEVALTCFSLGACLFTTTLTVVSRLHRHASPGSTSRVETVPSANTNQ